MQERERLILLVKLSRAKIGGTQCGLSGWLKEFSLSHLARLARDRLAYTICDLRLLQIHYQRTSAFEPRFVGLPICILAFLHNLHNRLQQQFPIRTGPACEMQGLHLERQARVKAKKHAIALCLGMCIEVCTE